MADDQGVELERAAAAWQSAHNAAERARVAVVEARDEEEARRVDLAAAVVAAYRAGFRQRDIVARTGLNRETVRRHLRAAGVEA